MSRVKLAFLAAGVTVLLCVVFGAIMRRIGVTADDQQAHD